METNMVDDFLSLLDEAQKSFYNSGFSDARNEDSAMRKCLESGFSVSECRAKVGESFDNEARTLLTNMLLFLDSEYKKGFINGKQERPTK